MPQKIETGRRPPRAKLSQPVRVRPYHSRLRRGLYFETSLGHYFAGMYVYVTRNFHADDPMSREEAGNVVRVERLKTGKWGVAIRILPGFGRP